MFDTVVTLYYFTMSSRKGVKVYLVSILHWKEGQKVNVQSRSRGKEWDLWRTSNLVVESIDLLSPNGSPKLLICRIYIGPIKN